MNSKRSFVILALATILCCVLIQDRLYAQKKSAGTKVVAQEKEKPSPVSQEEMDIYRQQATQIVKFLESTLNFLADRQNTVSEKEIIINESYSKFFRDDKVQVEDDLDTKRLVPLYKDVQAYLTDVDFFFKGARFEYQVQDVSVQSNPAGQLFFKVTANRSLKGLSIDGDSVISNLVRYIEINFDESRKQIKIVSIYTTKLNEKEDLRNWWNGLSQGWKEFFGKDLSVDGDLMLSQVENYNDTVALVDSIPVPISDSRIYGLFLKIVDSKSVDLSGNPMLSDLEPLVKLSNLTSLNLSGTPVVDLMPLRNLNALEKLSLSGTQVASLDPLKYCNRIRELDIGNTGITDISVLSSFPALEKLDISHTGISDLKPLSELILLRELRMNDTKVADLAPLTRLKNLTSLDFSQTPVTSAEMISNLINLQTVTFNDTRIGSLQPMSGLPSLTRIYCDQTQVGKEDAVQFMIGHPGVIVIFASRGLESWWKSLPDDWQKIFFLYAVMDNPPSREQLHLLITIDSLNINGRAAIISLEPVMELSRLRWLDCSLTGITELDPLRDLLNIGSLNIRTTGVASLEPLSALAKLKWLNLDNTKVGSLAPVINLRSLNLILADNSGVTKEEADRFMEANPGCLVISQTYENSNWWKNLPESWQEVFRKTAGFRNDPDKFQLQKVANLKTLVIEGNPAITGLNPVVFLSALEEFRFADTRVTTLEPLSRMTWIKRLGFPKNAIADLTPLSGLTGLLELDAENTQVEDLRPVQGLFNMEILKLSGTPVKNLKELGGMRKLEALDIYNTRISNIDVLDNMKNLKSLKVFNTRISDKRIEKFKLSHPGCEVVYY